MKKELFFLRSSEQKIVSDMIRYAHPEDSDNLSIYSDFYGLTRKDLGLYALVDNEIAGAVWIRRMNKEHNAKGFIDEDTPVLSVAVVPKFRGKKIGIFMMEQFLQEAAALYEQISVSIVEDSPAIKFYKKLGFERYNDYIMVKKLDKKEVIRPSDSYDSSRWMD